MGQNNLDNLVIFQKAKLISDLAWEIVELLPGKEKHPAGNQFIRSADSVAANIAEGYGRHSWKDKAYYIVVARASLNEANNWRRTIARRYPIPDSINITLEKTMKDESYRINKYLKYLRSAG